MSEFSHGVGGKKKALKLWTKINHLEVLLHPHRDRAGKKKWGNQGGGWSRIWGKSGAVVA